MPTTDIKGDAGCKHVQRPCSLPSGPKGCGFPNLSRCLTACNQPVPSTLLIAPPADHLEWVPPLSDPWGWDSEPYLLDGALDAPPELQGMEHELAWHDPAALGDAVPSLRPSTGSVQLPSQQVALQPYDQQVCQEEQLATLAVPPYQQVR